MKSSTPNRSHALSRFLAISAVALALPFSALAADRCGDRADRGERGNDNRPGYSMHHRQGMMADLRGIDLSAAQVTQLAALRDEQKKLSGEKRLALREQHDALHKLVMSDAYTPAAAAEIIGKIGALQTEMAKQHAEHSNKLFKLLTPEQRTRMQQNELTGPSSIGKKGPRGR